MTAVERPAVPDLRWIAPVRPRVPQVVTAGCGFVVVVVYGLAMALNAGVTAWDRGVLLAINKAHSPALDGVARVFSVAFSPPYALSVVVALVAIMAMVGRRLGDALFVGGSIGVVYLCTYVIKLIVGRPRPGGLPYAVPGFGVETDPSYPSGHVAIVVSLTMVLFLVARRAWQRRVIVPVGALLIVCTAFSRMYVGAHYPDDVVASVIYVVTVGPLILACLSWAEARWRIVNRVDLWAARIVSRGARQPVAATDGFA